MGAAATFLTVAVAIQLELHWVTIVWAVEALMLTWVGLRSGERAARHAAIAVFCVGGGSLVCLGHARVRVRSGSFIRTAAEPARAFRRRRLSARWQALPGSGNVRANSTSTGTNARQSGLLVLTGNAVALTLLSLDLNAYFTAESVATSSDTGDLAQFNRERQAVLDLHVVDGLCSDDIGGGSAAAVYAVALGRVALLLAAICKVVVIDSTFYAASWHLPVFNLTFLTYAVLVAALAVAAWLYGRTPGADEPEQPLVRPMIIRCGERACAYGAQPGSDGLLRPPVDRRRAGGIAHCRLGRVSGRHDLYARTDLDTLRDGRVRGLACGVAREPGAGVDCCCWRSQLRWFSRP